MQKEHLFSNDVLSTKETKKGMMERTRQAVEQIAKRYTGHGKGSILIISHAAPLIGLQRGLLNDPKAVIKCGVCSLGKFEKNENGTWTQVMNGDCSHLSGGDQWGWEFPEDKKEKEHTEKREKKSN